MDIFSEYMVKRKRTAIDIVKIVLCILAIAAVLFVMPLMAVIPYVGSIVFLLCAGLIYLLYNVIIGINVEYEYAFTNGALDVDKIIAARRRKRVISLNAREIEMMGTVKNRAFANYRDNREIKKYYACTSIDDENVYFVVFLNDGKRCMLLFNPNDTIKDGFRRLNPQKVFLTD